MQFFAGFFRCMRQLPGWFPQLFQLGSARIRSQVRLLALAGLVGIVAGVGAIVFYVATLETLLRKEIETQTGVVNAAESRDPAYSTAASGLVAMLQLAQAATDSRKELDKLVFAGLRTVCW